MMTCPICGIKSVDHPTNNSTRDPVEIPEWLKSKLNKLIEQNKSTLKRCGNQMCNTEIVVYNREISLIELILKMECDIHEY